MARANGAAAAIPAGPVAASDGDPASATAVAEPVAVSAGAGAVAAGPVVAPAPRAPARRQREPLSDDGQRLLERLPPGLSLVHTVASFPHVINRLALVWDNPRELVAIVDDLLIDDRLQRAGFPLKVLVELTDVRDARVAMSVGTVVRKGR